MEPIGGEEPEAVYEFCGNVHIMRAMRCVAIIGLVLNPIWTVYMAVSSPIVPYDFGIVAMCLYALILVAERKENPRLLIPYLIFNALSIGAHGLYCIILLFTINSNAFWHEWARQHPAMSPTGAIVGLIFHFVLNLAKVLMQCWFEHIVYRAYLFMLGRAEAAAPFPDEEEAPLLGRRRVGEPQNPSVPMPNA